MKYKLPEGWKETKLGEVINLRRGHDLTKKNMNSQGIYSVIGSNGIIGDHDKYILEGPVVTVGRSGNVGKPFYHEKNAWPHNTTLYIDDFKSNNPYYIFCLLETLGLENYGGGSAVPTLNRNHVHPIEIIIPPLKEQKVIADTLSSLDDKIELNNIINENLEQQAQAIFKHWFIDFEFPDENGNPYKSSGGEMVESELGMIPKGWEVRTVDDLIEIVSKGTTPRKKDIDLSTDGKTIKFLKVTNIRNDGQIDYSSLDYIPETIHRNQLKRSILKYKDILISIAGTIGRISYVSDKLINANINQAIAFVRLKDIEKHFLLIMYYFKSKRFQDSIKEKVVQAVQANISLTVIKNENVILPRDNILDLYNKIMNSIFNVTNMKQKQNEELKQLRDTLLPKLMSGEIRIPLD